MTADGTVPNEHSIGWAGTVDEVRIRYRRIAPVYRVFDLILALPWGARARAVHRLELRPGERVVEVGCGTGLNLPFLADAVGSGGHVWGVDATPEMLRVAERARVSHRWENVTLVESDAATVRLPQPIDAILFSLSYGVMPNHRAVLRHVWSLLRPGGRVVVLDATIPTGPFGALLRPIAVAVSRASVLGNPDKRPWDDLAELGGVVTTESLVGGLYYLCRARKTTVGTSATPY